MGHSSFPPWSRHLFYRTEHVRTTWKLRIGVVVLVVLGAWLTSNWWTVAIARSLVCENDETPSDVMLIENFDAEYLLFERAARLRRQGVAERVLVPVPSANGDPSQTNVVARGIAEMMATMSRLGTIDIIPVRVVEPISINAARDILPVLRQEGVRSVLVVSPLFRSRRSMLVYGATLGRAGIHVRCSAVDGLRDLQTWTHTLHGIQNVAEQWIKLQYYRFYVLPFNDARR
jgi:hypothetical protein